ncbi:oocyte zinc finger protein XlCOF22-like [Dunckerocampus dactyliophorus]|uniref:oocyte zinc finger protein XlCOF22-like n=1 Tax=Dunckerocampus dactyliophorus TaxID=161453 RepID=UPI0024049BFB|nr:oocyte zinc finger protein XlCOF22-like [Dunckerocampus dactyliophorus]
MNHCYAKMATSSQREGGRESALPTPSTSSTEKKPQTADNDVQQMIGRQERPPQPQGWSSTLKQEDLQPPHIKEEEEELWITQEGARLLGPEEADLTKFPLTGVSVKTEDHEDKPPESLHWLCPSDVQQMIGHQEECHSQLQVGSCTLKQEDPQPPHIKEEKEELWITQEREYLLGLEEANRTKLPLTGVSVKTEDHEDKPPESSQLHHSPSEENRGAESPSSSSQHMITEADGDHCGGSQADNFLAPLSDSDDTTSHSPEAEDRDDAQETWSSDTDCKSDMRTHTDNKHSGFSQKKTGKKRFTCSVCDKRFTFKSYLTQHMRTHTGEKPFACYVCGQRFTQKSYMLSHLRKHTGEKLFSCSVCGKSYSHKKSLAYHMLKHSENPFSCSVCNQRFPLKSQMISHMMTHTGEHPFGCSLCGKNFSSKQYLTFHMMKHTGEIPFGCSVCGQGFPQRSTLVAHMRKHTGEKPFHCSICGKNFPYKSSLTYHMRKHTGETPFGCSVCGQRFHLNSLLVSHMRKHTGETPFACSVCGKNFCTKQYLTVHMLKHRGEKPVSCSVCDKKFYSTASMVDHMRTHTGEPFRCSVCGESFSQRHRLTYHMQKHKGGKPFSCSVCGKSFSGRQASKYHTKACQERLETASDSQPKHYWNQKGFEWSF